MNMTKTASQRLAVLLAIVAFALLLVLPVGTAHATASTEPASPASAEPAGGKAAATLEGEADANAKGTAGSSTASAQAKPAGQGEVATNVENDASPNGQPSPANGKEQSREGAQETAVGSSSPVEANPLPANGAETGKSAASENAGGKSAGAASSKNDSSSVVPAKESAVTEDKAPSNAKQQANAKPATSAKPAKMAKTAVGQPSTASSIAETTSVGALKTSAKKAKKYTVRFYDAFGNVVKTQKVAAGRNAKAPKLAKINNRVFKGWSGSFKKVRENLFLHPKYKDRKNVYYLVVDNSTLNYGNSTKAKTFTRYRAGSPFALRGGEYGGNSKGRLIVGYSTLPNGKGTRFEAPQVLKMPKSDLVLYPIVEKAGNVAKLVFDPGRGSSKTTSLRQKGSTVTVGASYLNSKAGKTLVGYSTKPNGKGTFYALGSTFTMPGKDTNLYGVWKANTARLRIMGNYPKSVPIDYYVPAGFALPIFPSEYNFSSNYDSREGYRLVALTTKQNGKGGSYAQRSFGPRVEEGAVSYVTVPKKGLTLYAKWAAEKKVVFNSNYKGASTSTSIYLPGETAYANSYTSREGYVLAGWATKKNGKGTFYAPGMSFSMPKKSLTLYAIWKKATANITYNYNFKENGTTTKTSQSVAVGNPTSLNYQPYREGYYFAGWNANAKGKAAATYDSADTISPTGKMTFYAQWKKGAKLLYDYNYAGSSKQSPSYVKPGVAFSTSTYAPSRTDFAFVGWNTKANGKGKNYAPGDDLKLTKKGLTLYAKWAKKNVTVTFNYNGGQSYSSSNQKEYKVKGAKGVRLGEYISTPYRDNYTFTGWNTKKNGTGASYSQADFNGYYSSREPFLARNITLYAQWQKVPKITLVANNGAKDQGDGYGNRLGQVSYTKAGKVLAGWNTKANGKKGAAFAVAEYIASLPARGLKLFAQWKKPTAKITLNGNGKAANQTRNATRNAYTYLPYLSDPASKDDTVYFRGWNTKANGKGESLYSYGSFVYAGKTGPTYYAIWGKKASVSFDANGGAGSYATQYVRPGYSVYLGSASSAFSREGYTLLGWSTDKSATYAEYDRYESIYTSETDGATTRLYAIWEADAPEPEPEPEG